MNAEAPNFLTASSLGMRSLKKLLFLPLVLFLIGNAFGEVRVLFSVGGSTMRPADSGYRQIYGNFTFYPELGGGISLYKGLYVMAGYGTMSNKGKTPELGFDARSTQSYYSFGLGLIAPVAGSLKVLIEAGLASMRFHEEALGAQVKGRSQGYKGELGLLYMKEEGQIYLGLKAGYIYAKVDEFDIRLGGPKLTVCLGFKVLGE